MRSVVVGAVLAVVGCSDTLVEQVGPSPIHQPIQVVVIVPASVPCGGTCQPVVTETPRPVIDPPREPECTEAFKVRDHVQWTNHCQPEEPVPPVVVTPKPPSCRTAKGC